MRTRFPDADETFSLDDLADRSGIAPRTIRYYIAENLLPPPLTSGRNARYGQEHLDRLTVIAQLKDRDLTLREIRAELDALHPHTIADRARANADRDSYSSAQEYLRTALQESAAPRMYSAPMPAPAADPSDDSRTWRRIRIADTAELIIEERTYERHRRRLTQFIEWLRDLLTA